MSTLRDDVKNYLQSNKIMELLDHLSEMVFFFKPEDPVDFMAQTVLNMKRAVENGCKVPSLYTEESLRAYFRLLDPVGVGMISWDQLRSAFAVLGFKDIKLPPLKEVPVFEEIFVDMGMMCLQERLNLKKSREL